MYRAPTNKEASARQEFIDKMFVYLDWDVYNEERTAPQYRDVEVEPSHDVEGEKKELDSVFRIRKEKKFFVGAKKPGVSIQWAGTKDFLDVDGLQAKVDALRQLQSQTWAEIDALVPSVLDKAFKGE